MIRIAIGNEEREFAEADADWINQQIDRRQSDNEPVCVRVTIQCYGLEMTLASAGCGQGGGGGRPLQAHEKEVVQLWEKHRLNAGTFSGGNLVAFLKQLDNLISC